VVRNKIGQDFFEHPIISQTIGIGLSPAQLHLGRVQMLGLPWYRWIGPSRKTIPGMMVFLMAAMYF
jgi:hypothetical protein